MGTLFGTDGIRGKAGSYPMTPEMARRTGRAVAEFMLPKQPSGAIIVGRDTRISGPEIEKALSEGIASTGTHVRLAGVIPTPAVAYLARQHGARAGIVVSASHNPYQDNGIKLFRGDGFKFADRDEAAIESLILSDEAAKRMPRSESGTVSELADAEASYTGFLEKAGVLSGRVALSVILDCANGSTYRVAPALFANLCTSVDIIHASPDGRNINEDCGSQHVEKLAERVLAKQADVGFAFDGDGDRMVAVDEEGRALTGDQTLAICALEMKQSGRLSQNCAVSTVMSNLGLGAALQEMGIDHRMTHVGDRYVVEEMKRSGAILGGEESGHTVFLDHHTTGDGMLSAIHLLQTMAKSGKPLSQLSKLMTVFPQILINVPVAEKPDIGAISEIAEAVESVEKQLGKEGRVLVRYSGTEPVCRVMVESSSPAKAEEHSAYISDIIAKNIGAKSD